MAGRTAKPVIFISYSHKDEPDHPRADEVQWLSFVRTFLQPAIKNGIFELWVDRHMVGGADLDPEIEGKLRACDIFILLVSAHSMASDYIVDREIAIVRERQANGEPVHFYPLLLTPTPEAGLDKVKDKNLRPRDAKPFSGFSSHDRMQHMTDAANEIGRIAKEISGRKGALRPKIPAAQPAHVHIAGLPETAYEQLVGRDLELERLDDAWVDPTISIVSLVAEGGAGKSALVNEWLKRLRADNYRGAEMVLGWSFYSQGSKERATSADEFLNWALTKLGIPINTASAATKGDAIAEALATRRVLLVLDGVEPLQHGPTAHTGQLRDLGLRALLRHFVVVPPTDIHGLVVLTSRVAIKDIARWKDGSLRIENVERLSDEAGAALLQDNGVWGTDTALKAASADFGGHPLALGLLASFVKETQLGDIRRRDRIRGLLTDVENPGHDHARRVMESYEREWLIDHPVLLAIMHIVGLFDRPASQGCLRAIRAKPIIEGLTDKIVELDDDGWNRAVERLRDVRLLAPHDSTEIRTLDAHPLVREWFGERLLEMDEKIWRSAHARLYAYLRDNTWEGKKPTLEDIAPLFQAIVHGCHAGRHDEVLKKIYRQRICRELANGKLEFYAEQKLGAIGSCLAAISWFFEKPYDTPIPSLGSGRKSWLVSEAAFQLCGQGRITDSIDACGTALQMADVAANHYAAAIVASHLSDTKLLLGDVADSTLMAERSAGYAAKIGKYHLDVDPPWKAAKKITKLASDEKFRMIVSLVAKAAALHAAGDYALAEQGFQDAERRQAAWEPDRPYLYGMQGFRFCRLLLDTGHWLEVRDRAARSVAWTENRSSLVGRALDSLLLGLAGLGLALGGTAKDESCDEIQRPLCIADAHLNSAVDGLRSSARMDWLPCGLLARARFWLYTGNQSGVAHDLDEVEEIAGSGPMKLFLCDVALERTRLTLSQIEAFAPLNALLENDKPPKPVVPSVEKIAELRSEAEKQIKIAADYIETCGYHRRDEELAELQAVLRGERKFADLPPRV